MSGKTMYVPLFGSKLGSSQTGEPQLRVSRVKGGNKRVRGETTRSVLKVKLSGLGSRGKKGKHGDKTPRGQMPEPTVNKPKTAVSRGEETQSAGTGSGSTLKDGFYFSRRHNNTATTEKEKAKLAVLRTISKLLEENQLIRQRLASCQPGNPD